MGKTNFKFAHLNLLNKLELQKFFSPPAFCFYHLYCIHSIKIKRHWSVGTYVLLFSIKEIDFFQALVWVKTV